MKKRKAKGMSCEENAGKKSGNEKATRWWLFVLIGNNVTPGTI